MPTQFAVNRSLGGITAGYRSPVNINYNNPASYSAIKLTTFEIAVAANGLWLNDGDTTQRFGSGSISYLAFAFPMAKFWGASVGLIPYSSNSYDVRQTVAGPNGLGSDIEYRFVGEGQLYQFYIGNGFSYKGFSAGFNIAYLFGTLRKETLTFFPDLQTAFPSRIVESRLAKDFIWNAGLQYTQRLNKELFLTFGLSANTSIDTKFERDLRWERLTSISSRIDTLKQEAVEAGVIKLPAKWNLGVTLTKTASYKMGLDVGYEQWSQYEAFGESSENLVDALRIGFGISFRPQGRSFGNMWKSADYNLGFYYSTNHYELNGNRLPQFALTGGIGIPIKKINSRINLALEIGQRGSLNDGLFRETFMNATFGFTLNDRWFVKRRFE